MDRNQLIGFALMAIMFILYFQFFTDPPVQEETPQDSTTVVETPQEEIEPTEQVVELPDSVMDQELIANYGQFAPLTVGKNQVVKLENDLIEVEFNTRGAQPLQVTLKEYKTYAGDPLKLVENERNNISWVFQDSQNRNIDLAKLYYQVSSQTDSSVTFLGTIDSSKSIEFTYTLPEGVYLMRSSYKLKGLQNFMSSNGTFSWSNKMKHQEHDVEVSRYNTYINFYTVSEDHDNTSERSIDFEEENIEEPVKWFSFKHKFFSAAIIAENQFSNGYASTSVDEADTTTVKNGVIKAQVASADLFSADGAQYSWFFGPNDFHTLKSIGNGFNNNLYLGWPPVNLVNRFVIIPLFDLLSSFISNYGIIIIVMVILIKLVLSPLSYKSYLSMAKMKVMKPELDELKEKHKDKDGNVDQTALQQDQMKLYRQVGVNPVSGCIPMLLQMPILFAMFYFFPQSIHLRQQGFLWATDLSTYDSIMTLPFSIPAYGDHVSLFVLLMTVSTILYTWSNNQMSTVQGPMKAMTYMMPVIFLFVLNSFPAALSFYYFVSNLVTFGQQAIIRRFVNEDKIKAVLDENRRKNVNKKKSKFMLRLEDAMKQSDQKQKKKKK